jgi:hypothetical protein
MEPSEYGIWVDDHTIDDDGNIIALVKHARVGVDPQVGNVSWSEMASRRRFRRE